ncbi:helix-turn-helix domain-containing protein [Vibrio sp. WJH972]
MLAIPVPFVVSMLLGLLAITLYVRFTEQAKLACFFLGLCSVTTAMVGLRWTFEFTILSMIQPIIASVIPMAAWYVFSHANRDEGFLSTSHFIGPLLVLVCALSQPWLSLPLDETLTLIYLGYGIALIRCSTRDPLLFNVSLGNWEGVKKAESIAGWMLIFSAFVDSFMSLDFIFNQGRLALYILTAGHLILLPVLAVAVVIAGINTPISEEVQPESKEADRSESERSLAMTKQEALLITDKLDEKVRQNLLYLDPELTLSKLTRKLGIPAKQISIAVNLIHQKNISKLINEYRIDHAKQALVTSSDTITQIFMNSGFQTKSNFNREFSRITGMTPSQFRKSAKQ